MPGDGSLPSDAMLSVSSDGSNGMQLGTWPTWPAWPASYFQYPRTDRTGCNDGRWEDSMNWGSFQYPRTDRTGCNNPGTGPKPGTDPNFQYPRTDRTGCNNEQGILLIPKLRPFSILGRIERDATNSCPLPSRRSDSLSVSSDGSNGMQLRMTTVDEGRFHPFSILGRIERDATVCR